MRISLILAHPTPGSFNHAIAQTAREVLQREGHEVRYHDLYAEQFDPLMQTPELDRAATLPPQIAQHAAEVGEADALIFVHPNWWSRAPAMLFGWTDRVLRAGSAYQFVPDGQGGAKAMGLLKARLGLVFNTANTPQDKEVQLFGDPLERLWKDCIFSFCGVSEFHRRMFSVVVTSTEEEREGWLREVGEMMGRSFQ